MSFDVQLRKRRKDNISFFWLELFFCLIHVIYRIFLVTLASCIEIVEKDDGNHKDKLCVSRATLYFGNRKLVSMFNLTNFLHQINL